MLCIGIVSEFCNHMVPEPLLWHHLLGPGQQPHHYPSQEQDSKGSTNLGMQKLQFWKFESQQLNISTPCDNGGLTTNWVAQEKENTRSISWPGPAHKTATSVSSSFTTANVRVCFNLICAFVSHSSASLNNKPIFLPFTYNNDNKNN